jgi:hypothetical protein
MMSRDEMKKYGIDGDNIDYDDPKTRRSFWRILDAAHEKCGFEASGDKILIQFYPAKDGTAYESLRLCIFNEGLQDLRAMKLCESLYGKDFVVNLLEADIDPITFSEYPNSAEWLLKTREKINLAIKEKI